MDGFVGGDYERDPVRRLTEAEYRARPDPRTRKRSQLLMNVID